MDENNMELVSLAVFVASFCGAASAFMTTTKPKKTSRASYNYITTDAQPWHGLYGLSSTQLGPEFILLYFKTTYLLF